MAIIVRILALVALFLPAVGNTVALKLSSGSTCKALGGRAGAVLAGIFNAASGQLIHQLPNLHPSTPESASSIDIAVPDDFESCVSSGSCVLRAFVADQASYQWEGVLCTTGQQVGMNVWVGLNAVEDLAIAGGGAAFAHAYSEQDTAMGTLDMNDTTTPLPLGHPDYHRLFNLAATDGELAFFANYDLFTSNTSFFYIPTTFVVGYNLSSRCEHNFTSGGRPECENGYGQGNCTVQWDGCNGGGSYWSSVIDWAHTPNEAVNGSFPDAATGLAVQRGAGGRLAVAHGFRAASNLRLFDKVCWRVGIFRRRASSPRVAPLHFKASGTSLCNYTLSEPRSLAFSPSSGRLWVVEGPDLVSAYDLPVDCAPGPLTPVLTLPRGAVRLAGGIAVGLRSDSLYVVDMGSSQVREGRLARDRVEHVVTKPHGQTVWHG